MKRFKSHPFDSLRLLTCACTTGAGRVTLSGAKFLTWRSRTGQNGLAFFMLVFLIFMMVVIYMIAYTFLLEHELKASGIELREQQVLYIAETGIERAMEFLEDDTDWSNNNGTAVISESFGAGRYSVDFSSGTRTSTVVTSTGTVADGPQAVERRIRQTIRRLPEAFNDALFWAGTETLDVNQGEVNINGGDVFTHNTVGSSSGGTIDVAGSGSPSILNGGFVYTTNAWTASGSYTTGTLPGDLPHYPTLDTTYYDNEITTANAQSSGNLTWNGGSQVISANTYVNGSVNIGGGTTVTGSGAIVATRAITIGGTTSVTPSANGSIRFISAEDVRIQNTPTLATGTVCYARGTIRVNAGITNIRGTFIAVDEIRLDDNVGITGCLYADRARLLETSTINGSLVVNRFRNNRISANNDVVTMNYDSSYLEDAAPGLGLDIDGDGVEEGTIVRVPGTWQQL